MSSPGHPPRSRAALVLALALAWSAATAGGTQAQHSVIKPWIPPSSDSLLAWSAEARVSFRANRGDSVTGPNLHAYSVVQMMATKLISSLGQHQLAQGHAVETVLDSLGLDTAVALDPNAPNFLMLMVNNPFQPTAPAIGFVYWYRATELRSQGTVYRGGRDPKMRVWWTGTAEAPYHCAIVETTRGDTATWGFTLLALTPSGEGWSALQWPNHGPDLTGVREIQFADINRDGAPEMLVWRHAEVDSMFKFCRECPQLLTGQTYVERGRASNSTTAASCSPRCRRGCCFVKLLHQQNRAGAAKLLVHPAKLDGRSPSAGEQARSAGCGRSSTPSRIPGRAGSLRNLGARTHPLYVVHFKPQDAAG
jgi:hypothetical protein